MAGGTHNCLAIVPARGGSKGVPRKNIRLLDGKPLINYAIEVALESSLVQQCIVNTDDNEIAAVARDAGAEIMMRSMGQGEDDSPVLPVIVDTLRYANKQVATPFDIVLLLQPTAPIRAVIDVDNVIRMFDEDDATDAVISVIDVGDHHPARMYTIDDKKNMSSLHSSLETQRRQDLQPLYLRNGCIYAIRSNVLMQMNTLMPKNKKAYIMPAEWLANIDTERDFILAEILMKEWKKQGQPY